MEISHMDIQSFLHPFNQIAPVSYFQDTDDLAIACILPGKSVQCLYLHSKIERIDSTFHMDKYCKNNSNMDVFAAKLTVNTSKLPTCISLNSVFGNNLAK